MMPHAVLSRRGAFGLAALFSLIQAKPAAEGRALARGIYGEVLEIRSFGEDICLDRAGAGPIIGEALHDVRTGQPVQGSWAAPLQGAPDAAPWGWDTLENVR
ncbi:hypothetical protein [Roseomonas indoligenes]|uniref:Uncharacterized protein n=1 Tax=Roseomonas indoligenes TaxID=2820811 RepID=A0A940S5C1_9PROT|nr:hypothetical protein [Pararoseomonas indoligenes]MBP0492869.1 hypothetical protein [Pararoseomonas indoligenes]